MTDYHLTMERGAEAGAYAGAGAATILWGLSASDLAVLSSAVFAGLSFLVHLYFSWRRDRREHQAHERAMEEARADTPSDPGDAA